MADSSRPHDPDRPVLAVIPARFASSRFPGKVLAPLAGKPVFLHVVEAARAARRIDEVLVATDDRRVLDAARQAGAPAVLTREDHPSGTDRIGEAVEGRDAAIVLNVQGDEPLVEPTALDTLVETLIADPGATVATLACEAEEAERIDPNVVKVVRSYRGRALYFSRADVPSVHPQRERKLPSYRHLGLYAFRRQALEALLRLPILKLEEQEGLEQLRWLEAGAAISVGLVGRQAPGVDTPEDLARCEAILARGRSPL